MDKRNQSAYPIAAENFGYCMGGLTKRALFAAMILQGYISSGRKFTVISAKETSLEEAAVRAADALLEELEK